MLSLPKSILYMKPLCIFICFVSTTVTFYLETTCSEAVRHSGRSHWCLWQRYALQHRTRWKRTANDEPKDTTFRERVGLGTRRCSPKYRHTNSDLERGEGASCTRWATNGVLSGDCWQGQLCPSAAELGVTKTQQNLWDSGMRLEDKPSIKLIQVRNYLTGREKSAFHILFCILTWNYLIISF